MVCDLLDQTLQLLNINELLTVKPEDFTSWTQQAAVMNFKQRVKSVIKSIGGELPQVK